MEQRMVDAQTVRHLALALPEAEEHEHRGHPSFRVKGKIFATLWPEEQRAVLKLAPAEQSAFVMLDPQAFSPVPGGWGNQGWTNVQLMAAEPAHFADALRTAWRQVAPKRLLADRDRSNEAR
jgi:hypothetical protein